jgi:hypothetical protein
MTRAAARITDVVSSEIAEALERNGAQLGRAYQAGMTNPTDMVAYTLNLAGEDDAGFGVLSQRPASRLPRDRSSAPGKRVFLERFQELLGRRLGLR